MTDAILTILLPSGSISMTIPAASQFDVLDAHFKLVDYIEDHE